MTDAEVICKYMHDPSKPGFSHDWWRMFTGADGVLVPILDVCPRLELLGRLHVVEAFLPPGQLDAYDDLLTSATMMAVDNKGAGEFAWHATAEQRIAALATVLRGGGK